jgi:hypothetical protein
MPGRNGSTTDGADTRFEHAIAEPMADTEP